MKLFSRLADAGLAVVAAVWLARSTLLEVAGGVLLVAAGWSVTRTVGLAVAGVWLSLQAYGVRRAS